MSEEDDEALYDAFAREVQTRSESRLAVYASDVLTVYGGDCRAIMADLPAESANCVVTSPPYWGLRDYGMVEQIGLEPSIEAYLEAIVEVFRAVRRILRPEGTVWLNLGDAYNGTEPRAANIRDDGSMSFRSGSRGTKAVGLKPKDLIGLPWRVAFALQADGWWLRSDIVWHKTNPMPDSTLDRPTKAHEYVFLLAKSERYYFDAAAVRTPGPVRASVKTPDGWDTTKGTGSHGTIHRQGREKGHKQDAAAQVKGDRMTGFNARYVPKPGAHIRSVWSFATEAYPGAHFATFPRRLVVPCVLAGCPPDGVVLDPFAGSGTAGLVANELGRRAILIDLNPGYVRQAIVRASRGLVDPGGHEVPDDSLWAEVAL